MAAVVFVTAACESTAPRADAPDAAGAPPAATPAMADGVDTPTEATSTGATGSGTGGLELEPTEPTAPADYGVLELPRPAPSAEELTHHALAGYEVVAVYSLPDIESKKVGFLRLGQRMKVTGKVAGEGCGKGWYGLPQGGFACASKGLVVDAERPPFMKSSPPPPRLDETYPYDWAFVRKWNTPMWWRIPTDTEFAEMTRLRDEREFARTLEEQGPGVAPITSVGGLGAGAIPLPSVGTPLPTNTPPKPAESTLGGDPSGDVGGEPEAGGESGDPAEPIKLPLSPDHPWLERGYFVSVAGVEMDGSRAYWRTARGAYVPKAHTFQYEAKDFQGQELGEELTFPVGFVIKKDATSFELDESGKLKKKATLERRDFVDLTEAVDVKGKTYMATSDGLLIDAERLVMPELRPIPKGLEPWERWIDVSLSSQLLVAYDGAKPVYVTLVSTGKKGTEEEPFETPVGRWRIYSKQVTSNMDGTTATDGNYAIQDVPWVMYFDGSYALHGAFWHRSFGFVRSHGCVNLGPSDARWLFGWTVPLLPDGWHGVHATDETPGTTVVIRE